VPWSAARTIVRLAAGGGARDRFGHCRGVTRLLEWNRASMADCAASRMVMHRFLHSFVPRAKPMSLFVTLNAMMFVLGAGPEELPPRPADGAERVLLCRPAVRGEPGLAKADALLAAARTLGDRFLDYGVACEGEEEAVRAARRAGLSLATSAQAEGHSEGSRFTLTLSSTALGKALARRELSVAPGADAVPPLRRSLLGMLDAVPRPPPRVGPWVTIGAGAALLLAGGAFALVARSSAGAANHAAAAGDVAGYLDNRAGWRRWRTASGVSLGAGAAAIGAGLAWRFSF
jgi:hypothetical protein